MEEFDVPRVVRELARSPEVMSALRPYLTVSKHRFPIYRVHERAIPQYLIDTVLYAPIERSSLSRNVINEPTRRKGEFTHLYEGRLSEPVPQHLIDLIESFDSPPPRRPWWAFWRF
jgi:hypothetical protein